MENTAQSFFERIQIRGNPVANPESVVICGQARFTVLTARLIRMEWASDGKFVDQATFAFPTRYAPTPVFTSEARSSGVVIKTEYLTLNYAEDGQPFNANNLSIDLSVNGKSVHWMPGKSDPDNLRGTRRTLDQCAGEASLDDGLLSRAGWSLFDNTGAVLWDQDRTWVEARPINHIQDWYFFGYGHDYKTLLSEYAQFGGDIPLIPRYVLGAWWSRFWAYSADDLKQLVNDFKAHDVPLDVLVVDMDWHTPDGWTGYTWNRELFPDPEAFLAWVHDQNLYATLNLHPADGILKHEAAYPEFAQRMGIDPASGVGVAFNAADKRFIQNYFELLHHPMEEQGIDFWWIDWQQGTSTEIKNLDPLPWLNHLHFHDATRRGNRPMLYSRWGGLGNHRYPIGFSGDAYTTWDALAFQPYFTATAANVGYGWWSHDIGGHFGAADPELYARWVQFGAVSPCLRLHSTKDPLAERRPWGFPEHAYHAARSAMQFRYQLLPYLYSAARNLSQRGLSLCYPMYYDYPDSDDAYLARDQYFLGNQLIAAPVVRPADPQTGLAEVNVWIPEGTWYEFTTGERFVGPRWVRQQVDLNRIPLFAKAGAVIPMASGLMHTKELDGSHYTLVVFPGADGEFELYEDDGTTEAYKQGTFATTCIRVKPSDKALNISVGASQGENTAFPSERTFELQLRGVRKPNQVTVNQVLYADWIYDADNQSSAIALPETDRTQSLDVIVQTAAVSEKTTIESFAHVFEYTAFEDAREALGTLVIGAPADGSTFDAEVRWRHWKHGVEAHAQSVTLKNCHARQILPTPFHDEGDFTTQKWAVSVDITWNGKTIPYHFESQTAYPSLTQWQTLVYDPAQNPHTISDVLKAGSLNEKLDWTSTPQTTTNSLNLKQPYGVVLLEAERSRILAKESLEACLATTITSARDRDAVLYAQHVGDAIYYLNGVKLQPIEPIVHLKLDPMFYSWMPPQQNYYALPLCQGENTLVVFSHHNTEIGWWGVGATVFDADGQVFI